LNHYTSPRFWFYYRQLPPEIQKLADKNFLFQTPYEHPSRPSDDGCGFFALILTNEGEPMAKAA